MRLIAAAFAVLILTTLPLLAVVFLHPSANLIGLELLSLAGGLIAMLLLVAAGIRAIWRMVRYGEW